MFSTAVHFQDNDSGHCCKARNVKPFSTKPACEGVLDIITYVCATTDSITFTALSLMPCELIIKVISNKKTGLILISGTISLDYKGSNSIVYSHLRPPGPG